MVDPALAPASALVISFRYEEASAVERLMVIVWSAAFLNKLTCAVESLNEAVVEVEITAEVGAEAELEAVVDGADVTPESEVVEVAAGAFPTAPVPVDEVCVGAAVPAKKVIYAKYPTPPNARKATSITIKIG